MAVGHVYAIVGEAERVTVEVRFMPNGEGVLLTRGTPYHGLRHCRIAPLLLVVTG